MDPSAGLGLGVLVVGVGNPAGVLDGPPPEAADNNGGAMVRLQRIEALATPDGPRLKVPNRYVDPDALFEFVADIPKSV